MYNAEMTSSMPPHHAIILKQAPITALSATLTLTQVSYSWWETPLSCGLQVRLIDTGERRCHQCGKKSTRLMDGSCYTCFTTSPWHSPCIIRPELCEAHLGKGRDVEWETQHHLQPHVVYLAISGGVKVGVTRQTQLPTRWLNQGATDACVMAQLPNRYLAGRLECELKGLMSDRTSWQKMLKGVPHPTPLIDTYHAAWAFVSPEWQAYHTPFLAHSLSYPIQTHPSTVRSLSLQQAGDQIAGQLVGIKGQYLLLDGGRVFNVRRHTGIVCDIQIHQ